VRGNDSMGITSTGSLHIGAESHGVKYSRIGDGRESVTQRQGERDLPENLLQNNSLLVVVCLFFFLWYWGLKSGSHTH
jgi:hypothetical protein